MPDDIPSLWKDVLQATHHHTEHPKKFNRVFIGSIATDIPMPLPDKKKLNPPIPKIEPKPFTKNYYISDCPNVYLTQREADCLALMMRHHTNPQIAMLLNLSPRTVEFYIKNMRQKLNCYSRTHLIQTMRRTNFITEMDTIISNLFSEKNDARI